MGAHKIYIGLHREPCGWQDDIAVQRLLTRQSGGLHQSQPLFDAAGIVSVPVMIDNALTPCLTERWILAACQNSSIFQRYMALVVVAVQCPGLQLPARQFSFVHQ